MDNYLPCLPGGHVKKTNKNSKDKINDALVIDRDGSKLAYSKANNKILWVPLLEKAYAKAHGDNNYKIIMQLLFHDVNDIVYLSYYFFQYTNINSLT